MSCLQSRALQVAGQVSAIALILHPGRYSTEMTSEIMKMVNG